MEFTQEQLGILVKGCVKACRFGSWGGRADTGTAFGARRPAPRRHDGT